MICISLGIGDGKYNSHEHLLHHSHRRIYMPFPSALTICITLVGAISMSYGFILDSFDIISCPSWQPQWVNLTS